jgi:hypothetical protein
MNPVFGRADVAADVVGVTRKVLTREKAGGRDTVGFFLRLPARSSGAIANLQPKA